MAFLILFKEILIVIIYICLLGLSKQETWWSFWQMICRVSAVHCQTLWRAENNALKGSGLPAKVPTVESIQKLSDHEIDGKLVAGFRGFRPALSDP